MSLKPVRTAWKTLIAVCKECDGKPKRLRSDLKDALRKAKRDDVRVVLSSCLDVCPKHAISVSIAGEHGVRTYVSSGNADEILKAISGSDGAPAAAKPTEEFDPPGEGESIVERAF